jgi:hypothetical protein
MIAANTPPLEGEDVFFDTNTPPLEGEDVLFDTPLILVL